MSAAAQRDETPAQATGTDGAPALRQLAAERLAAHRNRRAANRTPEPAAAEPSAPGIDARITQAAVRLQARRDAAQAKGPRPNVRDAVRARYQQSPSYQEFLAAEAERALQKARAEAEVAARNAIAVAEAQRLLLEEIEQWNQPPAPLFVVEPAASQNTSESEPPAATPRVRRPRAADSVPHDPVTPADLKIQPFAALAPAPTVAAPALPRAAHFDYEELAELDQEIAFRLAPEFEDHIVETQPIQANIIEFPRQLVASRKARPRLAEGPLREDGTPEPQLRIFEVEPEQVSIEPTFVAEAAPAWQSMLLAPEPVLDAHTAAYAAAYNASAEHFDAARNIAVQTAQQLYAAPIGRRVMAMAVDAVCVAAGLVAFVTLSAKLCGPSLRLLPLPQLAAVAAIALAIFVVLYHGLFFTLNEATPGMVYARLGLCTFADANPSRRAIRRRLLATAVAVCPLGLGMLWIALDPDKLGWHDRISRMYPRAY
jgi:uncharacterized RDD family membrane protein YckC